jgi:hypothetical protein
MKSAKATRVGSSKDRAAALERDGPKTKTFERYHFKHGEAAGIEKVTVRGTKRTVEKE